MTQEERFEQKDKGDKKDVTYTVKMSFGSPWQKLLAIGFIEAALAGIQSWLMDHHTKNVIDITKSE